VPLPGGDLFNLQPVKPFQLLNPFNPPTFQL
jgi:hypothetical protein